MSFLTGAMGGLFGGGGSSSPPMPSLSKYGKWAQKALYSDIQRALKGGGFVPSRITMYPQLRASLTRAYGTAGGELESQLKRFVHPEDIKVKDYARGALARGYYGGLHELKQEQMVRPYEEQQEALGMGTSMLAQEKQIAADITGQYNQYLLAKSQIPTFGTTLGYGLGQATGYMTAAQRYAQLMKGGI